MYWRPEAYEVLGDRDDKERARIVAAAVEKYGRGESGIIYVLFVLTVGIAVAMYPLFPAQLGLRLRVALAALPGIALTCAYMLWRINGPVRRAVERYLADEQDSGVRD